MSLNHRPTIDDLLADSLVQTVMRADHVEPQALKTLLNGVANRIATRPEESQRPAVLFLGLANGRRPPIRGANAPQGPRRAARRRDSGCGSTICC